MAKSVKFSSKPANSRLAAHESLWGASSKKSSGKKRGGGKSGGKGGKGGGS